MPSPDEHTRAIAFSFGCSALASLGLAVTYFLGGQPQVEGLLLGVSLGGLAIGLVLWAHRLMPGGPFVEAKEPLLDEVAEREGAADDLREGAEQLERRSFLRRMLGVAAAALGVAALFPIRSLGSRPGRDLYRTAWSAGVRMITMEGELVTVDTLRIGGFLTVFPEGHAGAADSQVALVRVSPGSYEKATGRTGTAPQGYVAFSKICTHAGCPVGLYEPATKSLFCPCHQSQFAVMKAALPITGPATRSLPQLSLDVDEDGYLVATGDFAEPVGPGFWGRGR